MAVRAAPFGLARTFPCRSQGRMQEPAGPVAAARAAGLVCAVPVAELITIRHAFSSPAASQQAPGGAWGSAPVGLAAALQALPGRRRGRPRPPPPAQAWDRRLCRGCPLGPSWMRRAIPPWPWRLQDRRAARTGRAAPPHPPVFPLPGSSADWDRPTRTAAAPAAGLSAAAGLVGGAAYRPHAPRWAAPGCRRGRGPSAAGRRAASGSRAAAATTARLHG